MDEWYNNERKCKVNVNETATEMYKKKVNIQSEKTKTKIPTNKVNLKKVSQ